MPTDSARWSKVLCPLASDGSALPIPLPESSADMKIQDFLDHHRIAGNPFAEEDAQNDTVFKRTCLESTFHPAWDKIYGNPDDPSTAIVFGEKGAGKTALKLQMVRQFERHDADHPERKTFVVLYDDFNPFLDRFIDRVGPKRPVEKVLAHWKLWDHIDAILAARYAGRRTGLDISRVANSAAVASLENRSNDSLDLSAIANAANDNAVVELVQSILMIAIRDKASDVHFEPFEDEFKLRYRIDGVLYEMQEIPKALATALVSRVKVMSKLDIAERRLPQDGRIELHLGEAPVDLRVAVLPTMFGESVVLRVLDRSNVQLSLDKVGLRDDDLDRVRAMINKPNGIVVVTGPTGSGKTTTLYAALNELNSIDVKILTAEDPVEYDVAGLVQCQVNTEQELTFAKLLRSFLRQDPDIILVGEIRDLETAQIAIQASLTGHLVLTTLHTNDAPSTILRLVDLGVETFLLTATIEAIIAQRLVRRVCAKCKEFFTPNEEQLMELALRSGDVEGRKFARGRGCEACLKSGYKGRLALFEIMIMEDELRELVIKQASTRVLRTEARKRGMRTLRESGLLSIYDGQTTIDEVVRETMMED